MRDFIQIFIFVLIGLVLLWFGYTLYFSPQGIFFGYGKKKKHRRSRGEDGPKTSQFCPVCSVVLFPGELVKTVVFPSFTGEYRLTYILGCDCCLNEERPRFCPVCGSRLRDDEFLVARMYDRPCRNHLHIIGCSRCRLRKKRPETAPRPLV